MNTTDQIDMFSGVTPKYPRSILVRAHVRRVETPAARSTDDDTSHIAADKHTASGKRHTNMQAVIDLVRSMPGRTSRELSVYGHMDRTEVGRRLSDAITAVAVRKGDKRTCAINGSLANTWWPVA